MNRFEHLRAFYSPLDNTCDFDNNLDSMCRCKTRTDVDGLTWERIYEKEILGNSGVGFYPNNGRPLFTMQTDVRSRSLKVARFGFRLF